MGGGSFWTVIFSVKSEARSELRLSRGAEVGMRRSGCEGSPRGGRRTHCRGTGGRGQREGVRARLSRAATRLLLWASRTLVPPVTWDLGSPAHPHPSWQGSMAPSPSYLPGILRDAPTGASTAEFHTPGRGCHPPSPKRSSQAKLFLPRAGDGFATRLHCPPSWVPTPRRWKGPSHLPLWHISTPSPLSPALLRCN